MKINAFVRGMVLSMALPVAVAAVVSCPRAASACGGEVYYERDSNTQLVAKAEQALSQGKLATAAAKAIQAYPALKIVKPGTLPLADRALRILALASVRAGGAVNAGGFKGGSAGDRAGNLEWSIDVLRGLNARRLNNPSYQTDLAEALARVPAHRAEAAAMLEDLAGRDLLTSAEGYAALARIRAESGDATARDEAVKRCEGMSKTPSLCAVPAVAVGDTAKPAGQT